MKNILFLTGTRADFGKIKTLIEVLSGDKRFNVHVFVTGMHMQELYGSTYIEVERCGFKNIYKFVNATSESTMDLTLAKTIEGLSRYIREFRIDLVVVHGDRVEALAGAIVGSLNNILVAHIEGGEISGTVDDLIRHAVSKMSHAHFVANEEAKRRLIQLGESENSIFIIGSPDMDVMFSENLPDIQTVKSYYTIPFEKYGIVMYHPVTTEYNNTKENAENLVNVLLEDKRNYVVIYPNNDLGSTEILTEYKRLTDNARFRIFPSIRFEYFLTLLRNADFIIGNSSAGIREAPAYGIPSIDIGTRQQNRATAASIIKCGNSCQEIRNAINSVEKCNANKVILFGDGKSSLHFHEVLSLNEFWKIAHQKKFNDLVSV